MPESISYTEAALTKALKQHDAGAFEYLYNNYKGALLTVILQIISDRAIAADVLHEAFVTA